MSKIKSGVALILVSIIVLFSFCSCGGGEAILEIPYHIYDSYTGNSNGTNGVYNTARLFIDNTYSVYGYLLSGTGEKSGYSEVVSQLSEFMNKYNTEEYYCLEDAGNNETQWIKKEEKDFNFRTKDFFSVFGRLSNPYDSDVDMSTGLNIYVTDLAEGAKVNKEFAESINENIISGKDRSALLYCFLAKYNGYNSVDNTNVIVDDWGKLEQQTEKITVNKKPIYVIVSGSTREVEAFYKEFNGRIGEKGYKEGENYYFEKFLSGRGLKSADAALRTDMFSVSRASLENDPLDGFYRMDNTDLNFDMEETLSNVVFTDLYEELPGLFVKATSAQAGTLSGTQKFERRFSFLVDLPKTADAKNVEYTFMIDDIYYANESTIEEVPVETSAAETTVAETTAEGEEKKDEPRVEVVKVEKFVEMTDDDKFTLISDKNELRLMTSKAQLVTDDFSIKRIDKAKVDGLGKKGEGVAEDISVSAGSEGSYLVTITTSASQELERKYDALIICYSVKAVSEADGEIPGWIKKYNTDTAAENGNKNINTYAEDLKYVYEYLNGTMANEDLKQQYAEYMATTVCSFPVLIDLREANR